MKKIYLLFVLITLSCLLFGQISTPDIPWSFTNKTSDIQNIDVYDMTPPNVQKLLQDDEQMIKYDKKLRIGAIQTVNIDANNYGTYDYLPNGDVIWRLKVTSKDAKALNTLFDYFNLPSGVKLFIYNPDKSIVLGAYTSELNNKDNVLAIQALPGDEMIIEFNIPNNVTNLSFFHIGEICYVYRDVLFEKSSGACNVNVACSEGTGWTNQKNGVAKIELRAGSYVYLCTGSLVNNTNNDCTPYFLTADHCGYESSTSDLNYWVFYFNYEATSCSGTSPQYSNHTVTGCTLVACDTYGSTNTGSDFYLVKFKNNVPTSYNPYYNGWSRSTNVSNSGVGIHHPNGDIKKISTYQNTLSSGYTTHWSVRWVATANGHGVTEGGSSGSPLFNSNGRIIGTLTGGSSDCDATDQADYYGKFSYHWASNGSTSNKQLKPWLDPINSNPTEINGRGACGTDINTYIISQNNIDIYPNPATDYINIQLENSNVNSFILNIYDILGNLILNESVNNFQNVYILNISNYNRGTYILNIITDKDSYSLPFIVQ
ncbi:MAG TPA: T9SS type A sorting domain-containing protein, partial [Bacteroidales bacterium]|nr:T9SS type A sorting domain-containing protein [Bacteroidales bacterium]